MILFSINRYENRRFIEISKTKKLVGIKQSHKYELPGLTHALNQKNNDMCNIIHSDI